VDVVRTEAIVGFVKDFEPQAIKPRNSAVGGHPNETPTVLQNAVDLPVRQAILNAKTMDNRQVVLRRDRYPKAA